MITPRKIHPIFYISIGVFWMFLIIIYALYHNTPTIIYTYPTNINVRMWHYEGGDTYYYDLLINGRWITQDVR